MTRDEEENAVRQIGELLGYQKLVEIARRLQSMPTKPIDLSRGHCIHKQPLSHQCDECNQANAGSVR